MIILLRHSSQYSNGQYTRFIKMVLPVLIIVVFNLYFSPHTFLLPHLQFTINEIIKTFKHFPILILKKYMSSFHQEQLSNNVKKKMRCHY